MTQLKGGEGDDTITGSSGDDSIDARGGNDLIDGKAGNDHIDAGEGNDTVHGGDGNDTIIGDDGADLLWGGTGDDDLRGGSGIGELHGEEGNDIISGSGLLDGGDGNDILTLTGSGLSTLLGGSGDDIIYCGRFIGPTNADPEVDGGAGDDIVYLFVDDVAKTKIIDGGEGNNTLYLNPGYSTDPEWDGVVRDQIDASNFRNFHRILLTQNDPGGSVFLTMTDAMFDSTGTMIISWQQDAQRGLDGPDNIFIDASAVVDGRIEFHGGVFSDTVTGGAQNDLINGAADDIAKLVDRGDVLSGGGGNDTVNGSIAADQLSGDDGNDTLFGDKGADTLTGGTGNDHLDGGDGLDTAIFTGNASDYTVTEITYNTFEVRDNRVDGDGTDTIVDVNALKFADQTVDVVIAGLEIIGDDTSETLSGGDNADHVDGEGGNDTLEGNDGNDLMEGGDGNDRVVGGKGNDFVYGGDGNDTLVGQAGSDVLQGGTGNDTYDLGSDDDTVKEQASSNSRKAAAASDIDTILSTISRDLSHYKNVENLTLKGSADIDGTGSSLDNVLIGNAGKNTLDGVAGNDTLSAGDGNDTLIGGAGQDVMTGGKGADVFVFEALRDSAASAARRDVIMDFAHGVDRIDLHLIDAKASSDRDDPFTFVAREGAAFSGKAGQLIWDQQSVHGKWITVISGDDDGDKHADFSIELHGKVTLDGHDFML